MGRLGEEAGKEENGIEFLAGCRNLADWKGRIQKKTGLPGGWQDRLVKPLGGNSGWLLAGESARSGHHGPAC
jgi:hypothetical protein